MDRYRAYFDGFSFYNGLTKPTNLKWCNLLKLCELMFPTKNIVKVKIFAANSKPLLDDPKAPDRQLIYFNALETVPKIRVYRYTYSPQWRYLPLYSELKKKKLVKAQVFSYQEKGADVNMAIHIIRDAALDLYDSAIVFTNDLDFEETIKMARHEFGRRVYVVTTNLEGIRKPSMPLITASTNNYFVTTKLLVDSQFPDPIKVKGKNPIRKPKSW